MRGVWLALVLTSIACDADDGAATSIDLLVPGTFDPLEDGTVYEVNLRPQGVYGGLVDVQVYGVPVDAVPSFGFAIDTVDGTRFADQRYLTTSTGELQPDGSFTIRELPVVFADNAPPEAVDGVSATLTADIESEPPAQTRVDVTLRIVDSP